MGSTNLPTMGSDSPLFERLSAWVLEQLSVGVVFIDRDGVIIWTNSKAAEIAGVDQSCMRGKVFYDQPEFQKAKLAEAVHSIMAVGRLGKAPKPRLCLDSHFDNIYRVEILPIAVGQEVLAAAILFWDGVDAAASGVEVDHLPQQLGAAITLSADEIIVIDQGFVIRQASKTALKRMKLTSAAQIEGKICYRFIFGEQKPCAHCPAISVWSDDGGQNELPAGLCKTTESAKVPQAIPIKDGNRTTYQVAVNCIQKLNGKYSKTFSATKTNEQASSQEFSEQDALSRLNAGIFDVIPFAAIVIDSDYHILSCNAAWKQLFGHGEVDLIAADLLSIAAEFDNDEFRQSIEQCFKTGFACSTKRKSAVPGAKEGDWLRHTITRLPEAAGVEAVLIVSEKITEPPTSCSDKHIADKYDTLCRFASRLSHDINNPLGVLMNQLEMLRAEDLRDEDSLERLENEIDLAQRQVNRMCTIIESVSALQSHQSEDVTLTNLQLIIDRAAIIANLHRPFKGVSIELADMGNLPPIYCCEVRIERALTELCKNALEAAGETGKVLVSAEYQEETEQFVIRIRDTGVGIPRENMDKIFEAFFTTKKKGPKTVGLGLTIALAAIIGHNGSLTLNSEPGKGTEAVVVLPQSPTDGFRK